MSLEFFSTRKDYGEGILDCRLLIEGCTKEFASSEDSRVTTLVKIVTELCKKKQEAGQTLKIWDFGQVIRGLSRLSSKESSDEYELWMVVIGKIEVVASEQLPGYVVKRTRLAAKCRKELEGRNGEKVAILAKQVLCLCEQRLTDGQELKLEKVHNYIKQTSLESAKKGENWDDAIKRMKSIATKLIKRFCMSPIRLHV